MGLFALLAAMLATLGGCFALTLGIAVLLLPLLTPELSRPRDAFWGAVVLLLGLVLVTSAERLTGAPMLAVLCGGLLIGRLGSEVGRGRWNQLSGEERSALATPQRWVSGLQQLTAALARLLLSAQELGGGLASWLAARRQPKASGKRWVRPEAEAEPDGAADGEADGDADGDADGEAVGEAAANGAAAEGPPTNAAAEAPPTSAKAKETPPTGALHGDGADTTPTEPAAAPSPSPPAQRESTDLQQPTDHQESSDLQKPRDQRQPAEGSSGPDQPAGLAAEAAPAPQTMLSPQGQDQDQALTTEPQPGSDLESESQPESQPGSQLELESESVEVEILDPPPPQRTVPNFHAIDALLSASGALPPLGPGEPPLAEAELEPEEGFRGA